MKYLKHIFESSGRIESDNVFYFGNPNVKTIIEVTANDHPHFDYDQYSNLDDKALTENVNMFECYKVIFYNKAYGTTIEHDGIYYSDNIDFISNILPEVNDAISKIKNIGDCNVSFNMDGNSIDLLIHEIFKSV